MRNLVKVLLLIVFSFAFANGVYAQSASEFFNKGKAYYEQARKATPENREKPARNAVTWFNRAIKLDTSYKEKCRTLLYTCEKWIKEAKQPKQEPVPEVYSYKVTPNRFDQSKSPIKIDDCTVETDDPAWKILCENTAGWCKVEPNADKKHFTIEIMANETTVPRSTHFFVGQDTIKGEKIEVSQKETPLDFDVVSVKTQLNKGLKGLKERALDKGDITDGYKTIRPNEAGEYLLEPTDKGQTCLVEIKTNSTVLATLDDGTLSNWTYETDTPWLKEMERADDTVLSFKVKKTAGKMHRCTLTIISQGDKRTLTFTDDKKSWAKKDTQKK